MSAISTPGMGIVVQAGTMSLMALGASGDYMEVVWSSDLNLVLELTVGGVSGPLYVARHIPMVSDLVDTDLRILRAARHFQRLVGEPSSTPRSRLWTWDIFRAIWDYFETDAPLA